MHGPYNIKENQTSKKTSSLKVIPWPSIAACGIKTRSSLARSHKNEDALIRWQVHKLLSSAMHQRCSTLVKPSRNLCSNKLNIYVLKDKTVYQYSETNVTHFLFSLLRIKTSTCFEHYMLILRRRPTSGTWYIACVLCQLAAPGLEWKWSKHVEVLNS
jgi:hypothetical protein